MLRLLVDALCMSGDVEITLLVTHTRKFGSIEGLDKRVEIKYLFDDFPLLAMFGKYARAIHSRSDLIPGFVWKFVLGLQRYDSVVSYTPDCVQYCSGIKRKTVCWHHGQTPDSVRRPSWRHPLRRLHWMRKRSVSRGLKSFVFVSRASMESYNRAFDLDIGVVLNNPVDVDSIKALASEEVMDFNPGAAKWNFVCVSRLGIEKNVADLIYVAQILKNRGLDFHLWIAGDGDQKGNIRGLIANLSLDGNVTLLGYKGNPFPYMLRSDLYVCTSKSEGYGMSFVESAVLGTPIVSYDNGGIRDIVNSPELGLICTENTPERLAEGIMRFVDSSVRRVNGSFAHAQKRWHEMYVEKVRQLILG